MTFESLMGGGHAVLTLFGSRIPRIFIGSVWEGIMSLLMHIADSIE